MSNARTDTIEQEEFKSDDEKELDTSVPTDTVIEEPMETWFNAAIWLKNVDLQQEQFTITAFLNIYWKINNIDSMKEIEEKMTKYIKPNVHKNCLWIDLTSITDDIETQKLITNKTPIPWIFDTDWFFPNAVTPPNIKLANLFRKESDNIWYIEIGFESDFQESLELHSFPFDVQFLNIKLRVGWKQYKYLSSKPKWLNNISIEKEWYHEVPLNVAILEPAKKEWKLLKPWMDFRVNPNIYCKLIRLRVERKPGHYILYNILPLALITGLSFISIVMTETIDKLSFLVTLLLTIAAGRSELVPEMPTAAAPTLIDTFVVCGYLIFALMMVGIAINDEIDTDKHNIEWIMWIISLIIWIIGLLRFVIAWIYRKNEKIWIKRSAHEFEEWSWEIDFGKYTKVDNAHMFGTDHANPVKKGDFNAC